MSDYYKKQNMILDTIALWVFRGVGAILLAGIFGAVAFVGFHYWPDLMPWFCGIGSASWVLLWAGWRIYVRPQFGDRFNPYEREK